MRVPQDLESAWNDLMVVLACKPLAHKKYFASDSGHHLAGVPFDIIVIGLAEIACQIERFFYPYR